MFRVQGSAVKAKKRYLKKQSQFKIPCKWAEKGEGKWKLVIHLLNGQKML